MENWRSPVRLPENQDDATVGIQFQRTRKRLSAIAGWMTRHQKRPIRNDRLIKGFSHFVASITAPITSGWRVAGWGMHPLGIAAFARTSGTDIERATLCTLGE